MPQIFAGYVANQIFPFMVHHNTFLILVKSGNADEEREVVRIEDFKDFADRFGPIVRSSNPLLPAIRDLLSQWYIDYSLFSNLPNYDSWFHGDINNTDTQKSLTKEGPGSFLVRFSSNAGAFALARISPKGEPIQSFLIFVINVFL